MIRLNREEKDYINRICGDKYYLLKKPALQEIDFSKLYRGLVVSNFMNKHDGHAKHENIPDRVDRYITYIKKN